MCSAKRESIRLGHYKPMLPRKLPVDHVNQEIDQNQQLSLATVNEQCINELEHSVDFMKSLWFLKAFVLHCVICYTSGWLNGHLILFVKAATNL